MFRFRSRSRSARQGDAVASTTSGSGKADLVTAMGLDPGHTGTLMSLFEAFGVCFTIRGRMQPEQLLAVLGPDFRRLLVPASAYHFECGPADQRCIVQVIDLGGEILVAAVCTGGNASSRSMLWVIDNLQKPMEVAAEAIGSRYGIVSSGHFDEEDRDLQLRLPGARVVPIGSLLLA